MDNQLASGYRYVHIEIQISNAVNIIHLASPIFLGIYEYVNRIWNVKFGRY